MLPIVVSAADSSSWLMDAIRLDGLDSLSYFGEQYTKVMIGPIDEPDHGLFGYRYLLGDPWLPYSIGIAGFSIVLSIISVKLMPNRPVQAFILSCLAAYFVAFLASGLRAGFGGGSEALFWNGFMAVVFAPIWFPVCVIAHFVLHRNQTERR